MLKSGLIKGANIPRGQNHSDFCPFFQLQKDLTVKANLEYNQAFLGCKPKKNKNFLFFYEKISDGILLVQCDHK